MFLAFFVYVTELLKNVCLNFFSHRVLSLAAAISFYAIISLAPILVLIVAILGIYFGESASQGLIVDQLSAIIGTKSAELLQSLLANAQLPASGVVKKIFTGCMFLLAATAMFNELQMSLNKIWDIPKDKRRNWINFMRLRFMSLLLILSFGILVIASSLLTTLLTSLTTTLTAYIPFQSLDLVVSAAQELTSILSLFSLAVTTGLFTLIYKILPDTKNRLTETLIGGIIAALLFHLLKKGISLYIGTSSVVSYYGAAGVLIATLLWVYFSTVIILFGALIVRSLQETRLKRQSHD